MSALKTVTPAEAAALVRKGALLVDIREAHEHAAEHIPGARHQALSTIDQRHPIEANDTVLIFHCKSGGRTKMNAGRLQSVAGNCEAFVLGGGIDAWRSAGLPTTAPKRVEHRAEGGILGRISRLLR